VSSNIITAQHHQQQQQQQQQQASLSRRLLLPPAANDKKQSKINWARHGIYCFASESACILLPPRFTVLQ